jgi:hypothetical protein
MERFTSLSQLPGKPEDFLGDNDTIDFSVSPWVDAIRIIANSNNSTARKAALRSGQPNQNVQANRSYIQKHFKSWESLSDRTSCGNAWVLASRASYMPPCANKCGKARSFNCFKKCLVLHGHFGSGCADCTIQNWRKYCAHAGMCWKLT